MATAMHHPRRANRALVCAAAVVIGLAAGRFVTYEPSAGHPATAPATAEPGTAAEWQALAASLIRAAVERGDPSLYARADHAIAEAAALAPGDSATAILQGQLALTRHRFDDALASGRAAVAANPRSADALLVVVDALVELGRYDEASAALQEALDLRPGLAALSRASFLRELRGDLPGALLAMEQARTAGAGAPFDRATVSALVGDLHLRGGDVDAALAAYDDALQLAPELAAARTGRARALAAAGEVGTAVAVLEPVVDALPTAGPAQLLGELRTMTGDREGAAAAFALVRAAADLQAAAGGVVDLEMAVFEADHGDAAIALERARLVYRERPTVHAADAVAWALYRSGRFQEAVPYAREALRLGTADPALRLHAAAVLAAAGAAAEARSQLDVALAGQPWFLPPDDGLVTALAAQLGVDLPARWSAWSIGTTQ